jgi:hypothetical protein
LICVDVVQALLHTDILHSLKILGRFVLGFAAVDVLHRHILMRFLPSSLVVLECARLMQFQVAGQLFGLSAGSVSEYLSKDYRPTNPLWVANMIMGALWSIFATYVVFGLIRLGDVERSCRCQSVDIDRDGENLGQNEDSSSSVASEEEADPSSLFPLTNKAANLENSRATDLKIQKKSRLTSYARRMRKLLTLNVAIPLTMAMVVYAIYSQEVLYSSCALITNRYFCWNGSVAGLFLCALTILVLPLDYFCGSVARRYEERSIIKVRTVHLAAVAMWGLILP